MAADEKPGSDRDQAGIAETALADGHDTVKDDRHREIAVEETALAPDAATRRDERAAERPEERQALAAGDKLGRYVVLELLGSGGMGEVYTAYDPELDRRIALKVIRPSAGNSGNQTETRGRLAREAQAMAQLSHPNVIPVFDVGTLGEDVYVAMEFVDGVDLRGWLGEQKRSWREVLEVFLAAASGLAAAHAAGLVHRDFKPDNVLIGKDGRVRVIDFGLARQADAPASDHLGVGASATSERSTLESHKSTRHIPVTTETGAVMGTPAYMAPEQFEGKATDARTDQFNFAVALYEALFGERPFAGDSYAALAVNVTDGTLKPLPADTEVPAWLANAVIVGLSREPNARYETMVDFIEALTPVEQSRRFWPWLAGGGLLLIAATVLVVRFAAGAGGPPPCQGLDKPLQGVWDPARKAEVSAAFRATGLAYAEDVWNRVETSLDDYASRWTQARVDACQATSVRKEQSNEALARRMACLDRRLSELDEVVTVMATADADVIENAAQAAASLSSIAACSNRTVLMQGAVLSDEGIDRRLARVKALDAAGKYREGLVLALQTLEVTRATPGRPGEARALQWVGRLQSSVGDAAEALERLFEAVRVADAAGDAAAEASAWVSIVSVTTSALGRPAEGARWAEHAKLAIEQAGNDPELQARLHQASGSVFFNQKEYEKALPAFRAAAAMYQRIFGENDWRVAQARGMVASTLRRMNRNEEAASEHLAALEIMDRALGPNHPRVAALLNNAAITLTKLRRFDEAKALYERAIASRVANFGPDHRRVVKPLINLANLEERLGNYEAAEQGYLRAIAIRQATLGADHPAIPRAQNHLARLWRRQGKLEKAAAMQREVLVRYEAIHGADHELTGNIRAAMCDVLTRLGRYRDAELECEHAVRSLLDAPDQRNLAWALTYAGKLDVLRGRAKRAVERLEHALRIRDRLPGEEIYLAETQFALAMALDAAAVDRPRALELATTAQKTLEELPPGDREWLPEIDAWLKKRGG